MKLVVGLGNPGKKYQKTRHNLGFIILNTLVRKLGLSDSFRADKKLAAEIIKKGEIIYAKPQTYMNESGRAVQKISQYYKINPKDIIIIHDDKDMELGKIRVKEKGSSGGHKGVQSIIDALGTENFKRLKLGIAGKRKINNTPQYVLKNFSLLEQKKVNLMIKQAIDKLEEILLN